MPFVVGGIAAMVALAAGVLAKVDPTACLMRALLAFVLGWIGAQLWHVMLILVGQNAKWSPPAEVEPEQEAKPAA